MHSSFLETTLRHFGPIRAVCDFGLMVFALHKRPCGRKPRLSPIKNNNYPFRAVTIIRVDCIWLFASTRVLFTTKKGRAPKRRILFRSWINSDQTRRTWRIRRTYKYFNGADVRKSWGLKLRSNSAYTTAFYFFVDKHLRTNRAIFKAL